MRVFLAHGASGDASSMAPYVDALARLGVEATAVDLPKGQAERAVPVYRSVISNARAELADAVIGGQSYGGRVASLLAADDAPAGLVLFCYPLHAPGRATVNGRADHFSRIACPVLMLSGDADPLARVGLLREAAGRLPDGELVTYPGVGHSLAPVLEDAMERVAAFVSRVAPSQPRQRIGSE